MAKERLSSNRLTIDLTDENKALLEEIKANDEHLKFGPLVNQIISTVFARDIPFDWREELISFFRDEITIYSRRLGSVTDPEEQKRLIENIQYCQKILICYELGRRARKHERD